MPCLDPLKVFSFFNHISYLLLICLASFVHNWIIYSMILSCRGNVPRDTLELFLLIKKHLLCVTKTQYNEEDLGMRVMLSCLALLFHDSFVEQLRSLSSELYEKIFEVNGLSGCTYSVAEHRQCFR